jgi:hypothetical protein
VLFHGRVCGGIEEIPLAFNSVAARERSTPREEEPVGIAS